MTNQNHTTHTYTPRILPLPAHDSGSGWFATALIQASSLSTPARTLYGKWQVPGPDPSTSTLPSVSTGRFSMSNPNPTCLLVSIQLARTVNYRHALRDCLQLAGGEAATREATTGSGSGN